MEEKRDSYDGQMGNGNENLSTALFTAGGVLLMVCLKRASLLFLVVQQWRAWVFLVLNVVVLAIFFTSTMKKKGNDEQEMKKMEKKKKKKEGICNEVEACKEELMMLKSEETIKVVVEEEEEEKEKKMVIIEEGNIEQTPKLSKEELNERVEAFIAMFRQHLALDGRKGRDKYYAERKQGDAIRKHINLSSEGVNCFVLKVQG